jgi:predicted RNA-binding Zn ribbon-like protein
MPEQSEDLQGTVAARLLRDFVNTREPQVGTDELVEPAALTAWFERRGVGTVGRPLTKRHLQQAVDVREGLRALFMGHAGHDGDPDAVQRFNDVLAEHPVGLRFDGDSHVLVAGATAPLAPLMTAIADAIRQCCEDGSWLRLKACARDSCRWAFYDASRNKVRRWCSMAGCGNHVKMKRAYARRVESDAPRDGRAVSG